MHSTSRSNFIDVTHGISDAVVIESDPLLLNGTVLIVTLIDGAQKTAAQELGQFGGVNLVIFITIGNDQFIVTRIAGNKQIDLAVEIAVEPAGHGAFLNSQMLGALNGTQNLSNSRYGGWDAVSLHDFALLIKKYSPNKSLWLK
jgi:hypothetical protein